MNKRTSVGEVAVIVLGPLLGALEVLILDLYELDHLVVVVVPVLLDLLLEVLESDATDQIVVLVAVLFLTMAPATEVNLGTEVVPGRGLEATEESVEVEGSSVGVVVGDLVSGGKPVVDAVADEGGVDLGVVGEVEAVEILHHGWL